MAWMGRWDLESFRCRGMQDGRCAAKRLGWLMDPGGCRVMDCLEVEGEGEGEGEGRAEAVLPGSPLWSLARTGLAHWVGWNLEPEQEQERQANGNGGGYPCQPATARR
jgi:hypothetical protein